MKRIAFMLVAGILASLPANAGEAERSADTLASLATKSGAACRAIHDQRMVLCIVNATDRDTDDIASGIIVLARAYDLPLQGWTLKVVNFRDYVVSLLFAPED